MTKRQKARKKWRLKYYEDNPFCFYCGCRMILPFEKECKVFVLLLPKRYRNPDNEATLEHVNSRLNSKRKIVLDNTIRVLLACKKCNGEMGKFEEGFLSKEELWERSKRYPIKLVSIN